MPDMHAFSIRPLKKLSGDIAYVSGFATLDEARNAAKELSEMTKTDVAVFRVVGCYRVSSVWEGKE